MLKLNSRRARSGFWFRVMGSTGLFIALLGLIPLSTTINLRDTAAWNTAIGRFFSELSGIRFSSRLQALSLAMIGIGVSLFLLSLLVQSIAGLRTMAGRRNAAATNSVVQIALVLVLLFGVNAYSFRHYLRRDWTRQRQFTLPDSITSELAKLRGQTDIVVYQRHKTFGRLSDKPDAYDYAAERKVVEKVQDLVEQFREFGPQFRVEVLDIESEGYEAKLEALTQDAPALRTALNTAPENSIFFHARREFGKKADGKPDIRENVQRLSFNEFYQLDKTDSLGKSVIVLFEKRASKSENNNLASVENKVRRFVDPDATDGPDVKLYVIRADDPENAKVRDQAGVEAPTVKPLLDAWTKDRNAENTVVIVKDGETTQSSFTAFVSMPDSAARDALRPRGNLVLLPQGVISFARKVLAVEERRPRIGIAVIHEWLSTDGLDEFTLGGVKKALSMQGFDVEDIILKKKWGESAEPESAAYTLDETKYERIIDDLAEVNDSLENVAGVVRQLTAALEVFRTASLDDLSKRFRQQLGGRPFTEELRQRQIAAVTGDLQTLEYVVKQNSEARKQFEQEKLALAEREDVVEERRMTDLKAKMSKLLGECDLLIVPRMTLRDVISGYAIPPRYYRLDDVQTAAIKDFLAAGKPVLACFGPINEAPDRRPQRPTGPDSLEELLAQFGIQFGKQTVLFGSEGKALAERRSNPLATGSSVKIPPLRFDAPPSTLWLSTGDLFTGNSKSQPHPIASSMEVTHRNIGVKKKLDLDARHPRPIYFVPVRPDDLLNTRTTRAEFLFTDPDGWNEDQPFPTQQRTPRFEPPKAEDPTKATRDEKRRGSFPVGVALETTVPVEWSDPQAAALKVAGLVGAGAELDPAGSLFTESLAPAEWFAKPGFKPTPVRLAAIGHGGWFVGPDLSPAKEELLVTICNWLLHRDERLPSASATPWRFPRVNLSDRDQTLWRWGTRLALPGLFVYLGSMVLLRRRYR
jgi:hypothetical protein